MDAIKPKKTLVEETYDILVDAICTSEFRPGERLNQDEIAARLKVSRQPVNSAIAILKSEKLVEDTGRRGVVVSALDPDLFRSIYEYRQLVEPFTVRFAIDRKPADAARTAREVLDRGHHAVAEGDMRALLGADRDFHEMIYGWSGNLVVQNSMRTNWNHIRRAMAEVLSDPAKAGPIWDEHEAIVNAMFARQSDRAAELMTQHIRLAYDQNPSPVFGVAEAS
ncbi:MAG: GntR family transcriptional regulator [Rhodobacter sp.]|nr:GntR family transcriptional regulator [Rhodobacter sp.]